MLLALEIRDILIIDTLELAFQPGLNVLTGETGAGKSILLDALGFVLGWRGRADLVRSGAAQGEVVAEFALPEGHGARAILAEAGLPINETLLIRRINLAEGRKTAWVNDRRCSGEVLRALSETLVELHGQHDDRGLLNPRGHRDMLDAYGGLGDARSDTRRAWAAQQAAARALETAAQALDTARAEEDYLRHAVEELETLAPQPGEDAALDARRRRMQAAERIRGDIAKAGERIGPQGVESAVNDALRWLESAGSGAEGMLDGALASLSRMLVELGEAQQGVADCLERLEFDPGELDTTEERLFAIRALARKHGVAPDDLAGFAEELRLRLTHLDHGAAQIGALSDAAGQAAQAFEQRASHLRQARAQAAAALDAAVMAELAPLKMDRAVFTTELTEAPAGPEGIDAVNFKVATNPGAPAGALAKIASGGELSRFLLALKVCLSKEAAGRTMIFDEIDRGVGGATADAVGRRLLALSGRGQVLVVTHSPQVAALGAHHWRVQKTASGEVTRTQVTPLGPGERVTEIARMLSGDTITDAARSAARALLPAEPRGDA